MAILSKVCRADNFESHNSLKVGFTSNGDLCYNLIAFDSFVESNSPDIFPSCETNLDDSVNSNNFFVRGYLPLI